jgi:ankyrin repeat protein
MSDKRVNPSDCDNQALQIACHSGQLDIVKQLLNDKRVDPCANNNYSFEIARKNGHMKILELLEEGKYAL